MQLMKKGKTDDVFLKELLMGPMEVPGGSWIVQGVDPQGAQFALVAPTR